MAEECSDIVIGDPAISSDQWNQTEANEKQGKLTMLGLLTDTAEQDHFENDSDSEADLVYKKKVSFNSLTRREKQRQKINDQEQKIKELEQKIKEQEQELEKVKCENFSLQKREETTRRQFEDNSRSYKAAVNTIFQLQAQDDNVSKKMTESFDKCLSLRTVSPDSTSEIINEIQRNGQNVIDTLKREINEAFQKKEAGPTCGVTEAELKTFSKLYADKLDVPDVADVQAIFKADPGLRGFCSRLADSLGSQWRHLARRLGMHGDYLDRLEVLYGKFGSSELEHWVKTSETPCRDDLERAVHEIGAFHVQDEPMEQLHRDVIHHNLTFLYDELMSVELLFAGLLQKRVINQSLVDEINTCRGDSEKKMKFLTLLPNLGCRAFPAFIEEVEQRQGHVAQTLREDVARREGKLGEHKKSVVNTETEPCQHQVPAREPQNGVINDGSTPGNKRRPTQLNVKKMTYKCTQDKVPMTTGELRNMEGALVSAESDSTVNGDDALGNIQVLDQNGNEQSGLRQRRVNCASSNTLMKGGAHIVLVPRNRRRIRQESEKDRKCCVVS